MEFEKDAEGFYLLAQLDELVEGEMQQVILRDEGKIVDVALTIYSDKIYAFRDICPHQAFPLSVGHINGTMLECVGHGWQFDLRSGKAIFPPIRKTMTLYETRLKGNAVWVKVDPLF